MSHTYIEASAFGIPVREHGKANAKEMYAYFHQKKKEIEDRMINDPEYRKRILDEVENDKTMPKLQESSD